MSFAANEQGQAEFAKLADRWVQLLGSVGLPASIAIGEAPRSLRVGDTGGQSVTFRLPGFSRFLPRFEHPELGACNYTTLVATRKGVRNSLLVNTAAELVVRGSLNEQPATANMTPVEILDLCYKGELQDVSETSRPARDPQMLVAG